MSQFYQIAGLRVRMDTFGRTARQAEPYRCPPFEREELTVAGDWKETQRRFSHFSQDDCEYMATGSSFYRQLPNFGGMLLHASAVVLDGRAYLFTAHSGTGKSTHTGLWLRRFPDRAWILNDDKPALRYEDGIWYAYGTPWSGKSDLNVNARVPLAGICILSRGEDNRISPIRGARAIHKLLEQTTRSRDSGFMSKILDLLDRLVTGVPIWSMECNMDPQAALISYNAMSGDGKENSV